MKVYVFQTFIIFCYSRSFVRAFHFDTPDDFGQWRILLSSQAQTNVRALQQENKKLYAAVMIKMKWVLVVSMFLCIF
jgi:hypothetical protein